MTIQEINGHARKLGLAYERALLPLSKEVGMPQTAISILLFFANNPDLATARDICELRGLKRAIVSTHVERLVSEGFLVRKEYPGDRRKDILVCTEKAQPVIEAGRKVQKEFAGTILCGLTEEEMKGMERCFQIMDGNIDKLLKLGNVSKEIV